MSESSLRIGRLELTRLGWALVLSFALHAFAYGSYEIGKHLGLWQTLQSLAWLNPFKPAATLAPQPTAEENLPLVFVEVNPRVATAESPKDAQFYSDKNSLAANPDAEQDTGVPKIDGTQTDLVRTEDVPRRVDRLQPALPEPQPQPPPPPPPPGPGDLAMINPGQPAPPDNTVERPRPRTLEQVQKRLSQNRLAGEKMKQAGGVTRHLETSLDVKGSPFGAYDLAFIEAVQSRWFYLLDQVSYDGYRHGRVALQFQMHYDGRITDMKVLENDAGQMAALLCQSAVLDPAPYDRWPREMRQAVDKEYREVQITFFY